MAGWQLAQVNVAHPIGGPEDPRVADFFAEVDRIYELSENAPGFVWRPDDYTDAAPDPLFLLNLSVWTDAKSLFDFVYRTAHTPLMSRRKSWFKPIKTAHQALWWVPTGHRPTFADALGRLWLLDYFGPTPQAFTFKSLYPAPEEQAADG